MHGYVNGSYEIAQRATGAIARGDLALLGSCMRDAQVRVLSLPVLECCSLS